MTEDEKKIRLLLVDDEEEFRLAASQALNRQGFVVSEAQSGEQALRMVGEATPDVVVLDLRMGGMDGIATLEEIRKIAVDLPVIILTGHGKFQDALAGVKLDIVDFVHKPVDMKDLSERIHRLLAKEREGPPREKTVGELIVPVQKYRKFYVDQMVREIVATLTELLFKEVTVGEATRRGQRAVLVFDRQEKFVGLLRIENIVRLMVPTFLSDSPYSSYYTGMFLAQTKMIGNQAAGELIGRYFSIEIDAPFMEAVNLMVSERLTHLPIMRDGELVGILRDEDIFMEISDSILGR